MSTVVTKLIGSGSISDGYLIAKPWRPWVVWDGTATRPIAKRFKISGSVLKELDGTVPAVIPPSYIVSGQSGAYPVIYPDNNYYQVEVIHFGKQVMKGFWHIPYDSTETGVSWYNLLQETETVIYNREGRYALDAVKTYNNLAEADNDKDNVLEGTIIFITDIEEYYGKNQSTLVPWKDSGDVTYAYPYLNTGGDLGLFSYQDTDAGLRFMPSGGYMYLVSGGGTVIGEKTSGGYIIMVEEP